MNNLYILISKFFLNKLKKNQIKYLKLLNFLSIEKNYFIFNSEYSLF
jgi:hypothetical protein